MLGIFRVVLFYTLLWIPAWTGTAIASCPQAILGAQPSFETVQKKYALGDTLGVGYMADVFLGTNDGKFVAVKIPKKGAVAQAAIGREADIANRIAGHDPDHFFFRAHLDTDWNILVSEYDSRFISLNRWLSEQTEAVAPHVLDSIRSQLSKALTVLRASGVVHSDLNPDNLLIDPKTNRIRVIDFGISMALNESSASGRGGKDPYRSEAQAKNQPAAFEDDAHAVSAILHEIESTRRTYDLAAFWDNPAQRTRTQAILSRSVLAESPALAQDFLEAFETLVAQRPPLPDAEILKSLRAHVLKQKDTYAKVFALYDEQRIHVRPEEVFSFVPVPPQSYLDIGGAGGEITKQIAHHWGLSPSQVFTIDIVDGPPAKDFTRLKYEGTRIPLEDESVDFETLFMVLHHTTKPDLVLEEAYRVLRPGGTLIVRETDADDAERAEFNRVFDQFFHRVLADEPEVPLPGNFKPIASWEKIFESAGFEIEEVHGPDRKNSFRPTFIVLKKPSSGSAHSFTPRKRADYESILTEPPYNDAGADFRRTFGQFALEHRATPNNLEALARGIFAERMLFAKRQKTFFAKQMEPNWLNPELPPIKRWDLRFRGLENGIDYSFGVPNDYRGQQVLDFILPRLDLSKAQERVVDLSLHENLPQAPKGPVNVLAWDFPYKAGEREFVFHIYRVDASHFYLTHAKGQDVPVLMGRANELWQKVQDPRQPPQQKVEALAEFEWLWYWTNPFGRAGALSGDILVLLLKEELQREGISVPLRAQYTNQDLQAFVHPIEAYVAQRLRHWR